tara:strand:+ start:1390 stop:1725 length:336 start_codon:yes stop_codon:yes gene_type:complete
MKTYTPIIDSQRIIYDNEMEFVKRDKITKEVVFKEEDLQSITECKCCFKQLYTFYVGRVLDEEQEFPNVFWTFERADLNRSIYHKKANFKSEETPAQWILNDNLSESEKLH